MSSVIAEPVALNENGFAPFYWGSSKSVRRKDGGTMSVKQALRAGGLNFEVEKVPLGAFTPRKGAQAKFTKAKDMFVTCRTDTGAILGAVGKRYTPYQNIDGMNFVHDIVDSGEAIVEVVGQSDGGRKVWIVCRLLGTGMQIGGIDENITPYLTIIMDHAGNQSVTAIVSPVRPPCSNLLNFAVKEAANVFRVRHTETVKDKMAIATGREALQLSVEYMAEFEQEMAKLLGRKVTDKQFENFLDKLVPIPTAAEDKAGKKNRGIKVAEDKQEAIRGIYFGSENIDNIRGTRYGVLQSVVEYYQHETQGRVQNPEDEDRSEAEIERELSEQRTNRLLAGVGLGQEAWGLLTSAR